MQGQAPHAQLGEGEKAHTTREHSARETDPNHPAAQPAIGIAGKRSASVDVSPRTKVSNVDHPYWERPPDDISQSRIVKSQTSHSHKAGTNGRLVDDSRQVKFSAFDSSQKPNEDRGREALVQPQISWTWDSGQDQDITVDMKMDVFQDVDELLEEFSYFRRLGDFRSARNFFDENLTYYLSSPYVFVHYAELLLEQGDYATMSQLSEYKDFLCAWENCDYSDMQLLYGCWHLMLSTLSHHRMWASPRIPDSVMLMLSSILQRNEHDELNITSTEVKILSLFHNINDEMIQKNPRNASLKEITSLRDRITEEFYCSLYRILLRHGRIWDLRDIVAGRAIRDSAGKISESWSTEIDFVKRLQSLVADWSAHTEAPDTLTNLALLEILTILGTNRSKFVDDIYLVATGIVRSLIEHSPEALRSKAFTKWMLAQAKIAPGGSDDQIDRQIHHLEAFRGGFHGAGFDLYYDPVKIECPGWVCEDARPEIRESMTKALETARSLEDYHTITEALSQLVFLSSDPAQWFDELEVLQRNSQGDNLRIASTLMKRYMISATEESRQNLRKKFIELLPGLTDPSYSASDNLTICYIRLSLSNDREENRLISNELEYWSRQTRRKLDDPVVNRSRSNSSSDHPRSGAVESDPEEDGSVSNSRRSSTSTQQRAVPVPTTETEDEQLIRETDQIVHHMRAVIARTRLGQLPVSSTQEYKLGNSKVTISPPLPAPATERKGDKAEQNTQTQAADNQRDTSTGEVMREATVRSSSASEGSSDGRASKQDKPLPPTLPSDSD
ncbi:hypothetical protein F5Y16DRAFT_375271 [Xylariaceae sp. FL0255]|nr:hypothetical protein F5Y16DRAFT_375271 [Xylariaceae sp. FL0255]